MCVWKCYGGYVSTHRYGQTHTAVTNPLDVMVKWLAIKRELVHISARNLSCLKSVLFFVVL